MIKNYRTKALHARDIPNPDDPPVRVKRPWRGVIKGQLMPNLTRSRRRHLLRAGFIELVPDDEKKTARKKKANTE